MYITFKQKRYQSLILICPVLALFIIGISPNLAQTTTPTPVIEFLVPANPVNQPTVTANNDKRIITYVSASGTQAFPYPDLFSSVQAAMIENPDEPVASLSVLEKSVTDDTRWQPWALDLTTGKFTLYPTICNPPELRNDRYRPIPNAKIIHQWSFYNDPDSGERQLCYIATGERRSLVADHKIVSWNGMYPSPTGDWLLLHANPSVDYPNILPQTPDFDLYSYQVATGELYKLGSITLLDEYRFDRWLTDTQAVIYSGYMPEGWGGEYFVMDVSRPGSLNPTIERSARFFDDPPRYEALITHSLVQRHADVSDHLNCNFKLYLPTMPETLSQSFDLGYDCGGLTRLTDGNYLYLEYPEADTAKSFLYRLNPATNRRTLVAAGEFEEILNASPDGRYVALIQDHSGKVERANVKDWQFFDVGLLIQ
ncbi:MAG TPA: hypothetical protein VHL11_13835, partial [Phototrophicaceae bacterium]|nr:hypothetical protein [Phototrophicaceae bacterium]